MAHATDIVAYSFNAELICPPCIAQAYRGYQGTTAEEVLDNAANWEGVDRTDETTFDSSLDMAGITLVFPKVVFRDHLVEDDTCGKCRESLHDTAKGTDPLPTKN